MSSTKKKPLGRGLEALIPKYQEETLPEKETGNNKLKTLDISLIVPNDEQPRYQFDELAMEALAYSIGTQGLLQPIVVTKLPDENKYMLISGERRWRASGLAGLKNIDAIVIPPPDQNNRLELALIENTQRDDLKPLELATAYKALMVKGNYTQEDVAKITGRSRSAVANTLRLLDLPANAYSALEKKIITEGHARNFLSMDERQSKLLLSEIINKQLSVRQTEVLAKKILEKKSSDSQLASNDEFKRDPNKLILLKEFEDFFGVKVKFKGKENKGTIEIKYSTDEELERILKKIRGELC